MLARHAGNRRAWFLSLVLISSVFRASGCKRGAEGSRPEGESRVSRSGRRTPPKVLVQPETPPEAQIFAKLRKALESAKRTAGAAKDKKAAAAKWIESVRSLLGELSDAATAYSEVGNRDAADRVAQGLVALAGVWGDAFPLEKVDAFVRDRFEVEGRVVFGAQFFKPIFVRKEGDATVFKLFRFSVYLGGHIVRRYYLERVSLPAGTPRYRLSLVHDEVHRVLESLRLSRPDYWAVRDRVREYIREARSKGTL